MGDSGYVFHSSIDAKSVAELLRQSIDPEKRSLFSMSGYKGDSPLLGEVGPDTFRIKKRRLSRNDFAPVLYGQFQPESGGGTRIRAYFGVPRWSRLFVVFWLSAAVALGLPTFFVSLRQALAANGEPAANIWVGLVVPPALILFGILLPKFGQLLASADEQFMVRHIERILSAQTEQGNR